jgi:hypothetical protein
MATTEQIKKMTPKQRGWLYDARSLLDFLEAHPELMPPHSTIDLYAGVWAHDHDDVLAFMGDAARAMAPCDKLADETTGGDFHLVKEFGAHSLTLYTKRENVCTKRVVGTTVEEVEEYDADAQAIIDSLPKTTKMVEVEKVEWECPSLLAPR